MVAWGTHQHCRLWQLRLTRFSTAPHSGLQLETKLLLVLGNDKGCDAMGPLVIYDRNLTTLVISPLDNFMVRWSFERICSSIC